MTNYITAQGVQQFSITIASGQTTGTATINPVAAGAFIMFGGVNPSVSNDPAEDYAYLTLTNATTVTATRNTGTTGTVVVTGCVVDGDTTNLIKSVQYGTVSILTAATSGTATISAVTNNNTAIHLLGWASANATFSALNEGPILTLSGTTVTATRPTSTGALTVGFVAIEFQGSALNQAVQNVAATSSSSVTSYTASLGSNVVMANTLCFYGGSSIGTVTTNVAEYKQRGALTAVGTFTVSVNTAVADAKSFNASVVEFVSGVLNSAVQRSSTTLTGVVKGITTLSTPVNNSYSGLNWLGNTATSTTAVLDRAEGAASLISVGTFVNGVGSAIITSGPTATLPATQAGSTIVVCICSSKAGSVTSITDTASQVYSQVSGALSTAAVATKYTDIWYFQNTVAGVTTITATLSGSTFSGTMTAYELSGCNASPVETASPANNGASSSTLTTAAITTTHNNDIIIACAIGGGGGNGWTVAAPFTLGESTTVAVAAYYVTSGTVTNQTAVFTSSAPSTWCASIAAFETDNSTSISVTKVTTTANITASWEVFEFAAYTPAAAIPRVWIKTNYNPLWKPPLGTQINRSHQLAQGLVGAWLMNEGGGGTVYDISGNNKSLTLVGGVTQSAGKFGGTFNFNGTSGYLTASDSGLPTGARTLSCWFKTSAANLGAAQYRILMYYGTGVTNEACWFLWGNDININPASVTGGVIGNSQDGNGSGGGTAPNDGKWHHAAITVTTPSGGNAVWTTFVDGLQVAQKSIATSTVLGGTFRVGYDTALTTPGFWSGSIDIPLIYNRALTYSEVQQLYLQPFSFMAPQRQYLQVGISASPGASPIGFAYLTNQSINRASTF